MIAKNQSPKDILKHLSNHPAPLLQIIENMGVIAFAEVSIKESKPNEMFRDFGNTTDDVLKKRFEFYKPVFCQ